MKKITVAHITDRVTFPGVQINHIEEIELDNVSGLVFVKDAPFSDNPIPSVDVMMANGTEKHFHIDDIALLRFLPLWHLIQNRTKQRQMLKWMIWLVISLTLISVERLNIQRLRTDLYIPI